MDEKYLDDLLGQVSKEGGQSNSDIDFSVYEDSDVTVDMSDLGDISLAELDDLESVDLSDLELDDIDFDDVDVTRLENDNAKLQAEAGVDEDYSLDALLQETAMPETDDYAEASSAVEQDASAGEGSLTPAVAKEEEVFKEAQEQMEADVSVPVADDIDNMDLDDLFSALGIDDEPAASESVYTAGQGELDALFESSAQLSMEMGELDDILNKDEVKSGGKEKKKKQKDGKKKTFSEILFGEMDEEDEEELRILAENKEKKRIQKEQEKQEKDEKKSQKKETLEIKKKSDEAKKKKEKDAKAKRREEELQAELEESKNDKNVSTVTVVIVFALFICLACLVIFGTKLFSYNQVIKRAQNYFDRQRYRLAYDEVSGVDVKPKDEELRDRIYTVMYVERLYESYQNNMQLGRPDVALDALIRGLQKYDEHYEEAVELDIVDDVNVCRAEILDALMNTYHMTEQQAYELSALEGQQYSSLLLDYSSVVQLENEVVEGE